MRALEWWAVVILVSLCGWLLYDGFRVAHGSTCQAAAVDAVEVINTQRLHAGLRPLPWSDLLADTARQHLPYVACNPGWCALEQTGNAHDWPTCRGSHCQMYQAQNLTGYAGRAVEVICGGLKLCGAKFFGRSGQRHADLLLQRNAWSDWHWRAIGAACRAGANDSVLVSVYVGRAHDAQGVDLRLFGDGFER